MPRLASGLASLFGAFFAFLAKQTTIGIAAAGAFLAVSVTAFAAVKLALFAVFASLSIVAPPRLVAGLGTFMPAHTTTYIGLLLLAQTIAVSYDYWRNNLPIAFQLARG